MELLRSAGVRRDIDVRLGALFSRRGEKNALRDVRAPHASTPSDDDLVGWLCSSTAGGWRRLRNACGDPRVGSSDVIGQGLGQHGLLSVVVGLLQLT